MLCLTRNKARAHLKRCVSVVILIQPVLTAVWRLITGVVAIFLAVAVEVQLDTRIVGTHELMALTLKRR